MMTSDTSNEPLRPKPPSTKPPPFFAETEDTIILQEEQVDNEMIKNVKEAIGEDMVSSPMNALCLLFYMYKDSQLCFIFKPLIRY